MRFKTIRSFAFTILFSAGCIVGATIVHADQMTIRAGGAKSTVGFVPPPRQLGAFLIDTAEASLSMGMKGYARTYGGVTRYWRSAYSSVMLCVVSSSGKFPMTRSGSGHWNSSTHGFSFSSQSDEYDELEWMRAYWVIKNNSSRVDWTASESADYKRTYDGPYLIAEESTTFSDEYTKEDLKADFLALPINYKGVFTKTDAPSAARIYSTNGDAYSIVKLKYKIKPLTDYYGPIHWMEVFAPLDDPRTTTVDESKNKSYKFYSWLRLAGVNESPEYIIDPLDTSNHPDQNGSYEPVLLNIGLSVDTNRDGKIKLATEDNTDGASPEKPFRFWINDDDDVNTNDPDKVENAPINNKNCDDLVINGTRDLEDFVRLWINVSSLQSMITGANPSLQLGLKWTDTDGTTPAVRLFRAVETNGGTDYLSNSAVAQQQVDQTGRGYGLALGSSMVDTASTYIIPQIALANLSSSLSNICLLFEGCKIGHGQLKLVILDASGKEIGEGPGVWIDLKNVKSMYERIKALADGGENIAIPSDFTGPDDNNIPNPVMSWTDDPNGYPFEQAQDETKTYTVFVHGWNQSYDRATMYAETMFKRMWHCGYKGRFVRFRWPTLYGGVIPDHYNDSEYRAWKCGQSLQQYLGVIPRGTGGYTVNLVAHSMGNIVAGEALRRGATVTNYALLNAAVPACCYDGSDTLDQGWGYIHPNNDTDSYTRNLTYRERLAGVSGNLINFYLPADDALVKWEWNNDSPGVAGRFNTLGFKPQPYNAFTTGYGYNRAAISGRKLFIIFMWSAGRNMVDAHEAMAYAVQSPTLTVGAEGRTSGSISDSVPMQAFGFGDAHSAEFLFPPQQTKDLYDTLLIKFQITPLP